MWVFLGPFPFPTKRRGHEHNLVSGLNDIAVPEVDGNFQPPLPLLLVLQNSLGVCGPHFWRIVECPVGHEDCGGHFWRIVDLLTTWCPVGHKDCGDHSAQLCVHCT